MHHLNQRFYTKERRGEAYNHRQSLHVHSHSIECSNISSVRSKMHEITREVFELIVSCCSTYFQKVFFVKLHCSCNNTSNIARIILCLILYTHSYCFTCYILQIPKIVPNNASKFLQFLMN